LAGQVVEGGCLHHGMAGARQTIGAKLIESDQQDVRWCGLVAAHPRQNTCVKLQRRALTLIVTTALVFNVASAASPAPSTARADVPELAWCRSDAGLAIGSTGSSVACLQFTLAALGLYHSTLTQKYDKPTAEAMAIFQSNNPPLRVDGIASPLALTQMGIYSGVDSEPPPLCLADARLGIGSKSASVKCLQDKLVKDGFLLTKASGTYDKLTADAVRGFQLAKQLGPDGVAGPSTLAALGIWSGKTTEQGGGTPIVANAPGGPWPAGREPFPNWNLSRDGIPFYGNHVACTLENANTIAFEFAKDGADDATQQWATYIASREGGCNAKTVNLNLATRDDSHCTFQLNALAGMFEPHGELGRRGWTTDNVKESMQNCADAASDLWVYCGRGPWTPPYACAPPWAGDLGFGDA
jgi:peptidoglycan hydrolase-like protein with peptidoglycan-binding domain